MRMASAEVVFLSSSPPMFFREDVFAESIMSSPTFPSPRDLIRKKPQLRTGSRAVPIPENANSSFTSAAALLHETNDLDDLDGLDHQIPITTVNPQVSIEEESITNGAEDIGNTKSKTARRPRRKPTTQGKAETDTIAPARKSRGSKNSTEVQTKIAKGKVTKTSAATTKRTARKKATEPVSSHFETPVVKTPKSVEDIYSLPSSPMQEAIKRRLDWTPPRNTTVPSESLEISTMETLEMEIEDMDLLGESSNNPGMFANLVGNFGYKVEDSTGGMTHESETTESNKRKITELVDTSPVVIVAQKIKAPRKKPRTITELSTSAFSSEKTKDDSAAAPLLQYFAPNGTESKTIDGFKIPPKPRSKSPAKATSRSKSKKIVNPVKVLLSPESALQQAGRQDFVFGTSSQLARENSPTLLRDLHKAMLLSNQAEDPFAESPNETGGTTQKKKLSLWEAASMGDVEVIDMVNSPYIAKSIMLQEVAFHPTQALQTREGSLSREHADVVEEKDGEKEDSDLKDNSNATTRDTEAGLATSPKKPEVLKDSQATTTSPRKQVRRKMPDYSSYTKEKLEKAVKAYRFKGIKGRDRMIKLLEQCWESKQKLKDGTLEIHPSLSPVKSQAGSIETTPKKSRGRPRSAGSISSQASISASKNSKAKSPKRAQPLSILEEISDSDTPLTPSPPRRRASKVGSPPAPLELLASDDTAANTDAVQKPDPEQILLYKHITRAIKSAPRSTNPKEPSWHEKILLYDPIVLEDLAAWLNTGALEKVGWDGEVELKDVKRWCWDRGICCTGKETLRGGARTRL